MPTGRRLLLNLALAALLLAGLEGACRLREHEPKYVPSSVTGYALRAGHVQGDETINALGLRGEPPRARDDVAFRILCMGGSTTWGHKLADDETWPVALGSALAARGLRGVEVLNGGVSGWGLEMIVRDLDARRLDELRPDLVLVYSGWNHPVLEGNPNIGRFLSHSSRRGGLFESAFVRWLADKLGLDEVPAPQPRDAAALLERRRQARAELARHAPRLMRELAELASRAGIPIAFVRYPGLMQLPDDLPSGVDAALDELLGHAGHIQLPPAELRRHAREQYQDGLAIVTQAARSAGLPVLDVAAALVAPLDLAASTDDALVWTTYFRDRMHLAADGNAALGEVLADLLIDRELVPAP